MPATTSLVRASRCARADVAATAAARCRSALCASDLPLVLLPVRLETRFFAQPDGSSELRVRIYPDKIHLDSHEPELTPDEREWGTHYWEQDWARRQRRRAQQTAGASWRIASAHARAAWIARVLRAAPTRAAAGSADRSDRPLPVAPQAAAAHRSSTSRAGGVAPCARGAPDARPLDRYRPLRGRRGDRRRAAATSCNPLAVGPDPQADADRYAANETLVDRSGHEVDGRLRRAPKPRAWRCGSRSRPRRWRRDSTACSCSAWRRRSRAAAANAAGRICSTRITTPTGSSSCASARRPTTPTTAAPATSATIPAHDAQLRHRGRARPGDARRATPTRVRVGAALGLATANACRRRSAASGGRPRRTTSHMRSMNTALWQVGWGYFLSNMIGFDGTGLTAEVSPGRAITFCRSRARGGPVPACAAAAALRRAAGDLARPVASRRAGPRSRHSSARDAGCSDLLLEAARQRLAADARPGRARVGSGRIRPIPTPISPT